MSASSAIVVSVLLSWTAALTITESDDTKWELIFRYSTNRTEDPLDLYLSTNTINNDFPESQLLNSSLSINYKSDIPSKWTQYNVLKVKLSIYNNFSEVAYYIFNGTASNSTSWFNHTKLLNSSYTDVINQIAEEYKDTNATINTNLQFSVNMSRDRYFVAELQTPNCSILLSAISMNNTDDVPCLPTYQDNTTLNSVEYLKYTKDDNSSYSNKSYGIGEFVAIFVSVEEVCSCIKVRRISQSMLNAKLQTIQEELSIDSKQTNAYIRGKISIYESRPGAVTAGVTGLIIITVVISGLFIFDLDNLCSWIKIGYSNIRSRF